MEEKHILVGGEKKNEWDEEEDIHRPREKKNQYNKKTLQTK